MTAFSLASSKQLILSGLRLFLVYNKLECFFPFEISFKMKTKHA